MRTLSPMLWDFAALTMTFTKKIGSIKVKRFKPKSFNIFHRWWKTTHYRREKGDVAPDFRDEARESADCYSYRIGGDFKQV